MATVPEESSVPRVVIGGLDISFVEALKIAAQLGLASVVGWLVFSIARFAILLVGHELWTTYVHLLWSLRGQP